jgi:hypothetical protein
MGLIGGRTRSSRIKKNPRIDEQHTPRLDKAFEVD